jgi:two-component system LytT family sensor kinase
MRRIKKTYIIEFFIHCLFWLVMYYALEGLNISSFRLINLPTGQKAMVRAGQKMMLRLDFTRFPYAEMVLGFLVLLFYSCAFWLFRKIIRYRSNYARAAVLTAWLLLVYSSNYLLARILMRMRYGSLTIIPDAPPRPYSPGSPTARGIWLPGNWAQLQIVIALAFLAVLGISAAYFLIKEWMRNELVRSKAEGLQLDTELRFLRSQVSPHFLFNTLNNLFGMALRDGNRNLADRIATLSNMMRYALYENTTDNVSLEKEIGCIKDYLTLHGMRYDSREIEVSFQYPEPGAITSIKVAPMLFVPFVENAFKHGVAIGHRSCIALTITANPQKLFFTCENTDHSAVKRLEEEKGGIGLENVKRRLELIYPGRFVLHTGQLDEKYIVNLQIDLV